MLYQDMLRGVLGRVEGCPEDEAINAMRNACMEFCASTYVLTVGSTIVVDPLDLSTTIPTDAQVIDIIEARIDNQPILVSWLNDPRLDELCTGEFAITFADPNLATLIPSPIEPITVELLVVMAPGPDSVEVADTVWLRYSEALEHGCLARLLEQPAKIWANTSVAAWHRAKFDDAIKQASQKAARNRQTTARVIRSTPQTVGSKSHGSKSQGSRSHGRWR
jgi:hypothetical protein